MSLYSVSLSLSSKKSRANTSTFHKLRDGSFMTLSVSHGNFGEQEIKFKKLTAVELLHCNWIQWCNGWGQVRSKPKG